MPGHAAKGNSPGLQGQAIIEDKAHPSTKHLPGSRWTRSDEWYNFSTNVRGNAHVLLTMDESTYSAGGNAMGYDHPISWCKPYDGGRAWVTALGHFGVHYDEPKFLQHIVGGVKYAAGLEAGDCGGTVDPNFATNGFIYVYYSPQSANNNDPANWFNQVSRFTVAADSSIDPASEKVIIKVPAGRGADEPGHTGGGLEMDNEGNLLLGVGDDVNPHSE